MNWKKTWMLVAVAVGLFGFTWLYERRLTLTGPPVTSSLRLLPGFRVAQVTAVQLRQTNQPLLRVERDGVAWRYTLPITYPAAPVAIETALAAFENLPVQTRITARDLNRLRQTPADFGLTSPQAVLSFTRHEGPAETQIQFGARTAAGDGVYAQVVGSPDICVLDAAILDWLPRTNNDWRDPVLLSGSRGQLERVEVVKEAVGFALARDPTNRLWRLVRPGAYRADQLKVGQLLARLREARVQEFVTDDPRAELERFGLAPPELELVLGQGVVTQRVQFGRSPTNAPALVFARLLGQSNVVTLPKLLLEPLAVSYLDLRERRLLSFSPTNVDLVEVRGEEPFVVRRLSNDLWLAAESVLVDTNYMRNWLRFLGEMQVSEFVKDVVTDFSPYGLTPPRRTYLLKTTFTNSLGATNVLVAQLELGTNRNETVFAHRPDEDSVYGFRFEEFHLMPAHSWQLRDHRVWNFTTGQVARVTLRQADRVRTLVRDPGGIWSPGPGSQGLVNNWAVEETLYRLGELNCIKWVARGETNLAPYGIVLTNGVQLSVELRDGDQTRTLTLDFGGPSPIRMPYASTMMDGTRWIFEFPLELYLMIARDIAVQRTSAAVRPPDRTLYLSGGARTFSPQDRARLNGLGVFKTADPVKAPADSSPRSAPNAYRTPRPVTDVELSDGWKRRPVFSSSPPSDGREGRGENSPKKSFARWSPEPPKVLARAPSPVAESVAAPFPSPQPSPPRRGSLAFSPFARSAPAPERDSIVSTDTPSAIPPLPGGEGWGEGEGGLNQRLNSISFLHHPG